MIFLGDNTFTSRRDASILQPVIQPIVSTAVVSKSSSVVAAEPLPVVATAEASTPAVEPVTDAMVPIETRTPFYRKGSFWAWTGLVAAIAAGAWAWGRAS